MRLKEKKLLKKFAATLKKFSAQGAKKVEYGNRKTVLHGRLPFFLKLLSLVSFITVIWGLKEPDFSVETIS